MEGISPRPVLTGKPLKRAQPIFWEHEGNRAVRHGGWQLAAKENQPWELYEIKADRTEMNNLAGKYGHKVKVLSSKWDAWAARANVITLGAWHAPARQRNRKWKGLDRGLGTPDHCRNTQNPYWPLSL